jgi:hypothetical protein
MVAENISVCRRRGSAVITANIVDEAHIQHPVGLIEYEHLNAAEREQALPQQVEQAAGRGDEDIHTAAQRLHLRILADATIDHGRGSGV